MTQPMARARLSKVAREILAYLDRNPEAGDTLVGVARWWLLRQRVHTAVETVQRALDELVRLGLVLQHRQLDGQVTYTANIKRVNRET